ncbi:FHA domain-containing protein [Burkholderiaceae bacterium DAT-1]|nr:FHA domain-containing protein [Burkholderiaceae bacterium DAT-1]
MAKLILSLDGAVIRELPLSETRVRIGRKPTNELQIDHLTVSGEHARIVQDQGVTLIEDLHSTNGTLVNGELIERYALKHQDVIEIGKYQLLYEAENLGAPQPSAGTSDESNSAQSPTTGRSGIITILSGSNAGRVLELSKNVTSIGKPGTQVAIITRRPAGYFLTHVEGPRHPFVNGEEIGIRAHELHEGDIIELVGVKMGFSIA